jgi:predicted TIM-barrel fold metal-dependent hydrolase
MSALPPGGVDCDLHPAVPSIAALLPYMEPFWRDMTVTRGIDELYTIAYPAGAALSARPDWRLQDAPAGSDLDALRRQALDPFGTSIAIANCLYGVQALYSEDLAAAFARAVNRWMAAEWLDREPRLRASIVVAPQGIDQAVAEIERCAADLRFVQVLLLASGDVPLGKRALWPIYEAAVRHNLPIGIHAGGAYHNPPGPIGWGSSLAEDYTGHAFAFAATVSSLTAEGVFAKFPQLKFVLLESGVSWLPPHLWRLTKFWRGLRMEIPWVDRPPAEIVRQHIRLTAQPIDAPDDRDTLLRLIDHLQSDAILLFATDYPHWQFDGEAALPAGLPADIVRKMMIDNPRATYARLAETVA